MLNDSSSDHMNVMMSLNNNPDLWPTMQTTNLSKSLSMQYTGSFVQFYNATQTYSKYKKNLGKLYCDIINLLKEII